MELEIDFLNYKFFFKTNNFFTVLAIYYMGNTIFFRA